MTPRAATWISRGMIALALVMIAISVVVSHATAPRANPHEIVVVPQELTSRVLAAADALRRDPNAPTDPALADAPDVMVHEQERVALGGELTIFAKSPGAILVLLVSVLWMGTGSVIVSRQSRNVAGWVFLGLGFLIVLEGLSQIMVFAALRAHADVPLVRVWAIAGEYAVFPMVLLPLLWLLFPDGRPPSPRWRWAVRGFLVAVGIALVAYVLSPGPLNNFVDFGVLYMNPLAAPIPFAVTATITGIGGLVALVLAIATIFGVRGRFKRASGEERQQLRWLVFVTTAAGALFVVIFAAGIIRDVVLHIDEEANGAGNVFDLLFGLMAAFIVIGVPAAYLIAIYRYHLWDLDVVIRKAVIFTFVAGGLTVVALAVLLVLPTFAVGAGSDLTGWERGLFAVGVAIGTLFGPLRRLARRFADRVVYHTRATPYEVLSQFGGRVGETYATDDVLPRMAQVLARGTGASSARVLLAVGGERREVASFGDEHGPADLVVPVVHHGDELGALAVWMPANDPLDPAREKLVQDLAAQAGPVLRNVRLIEELRASRQRLVAAQDEERRKIERNLHDGAQQQLVALAVQLKLLEQTAGKEPDRDKQLAAKLGSQANAALEDLRDLARGIYPPLLADQGLAAALEAQSRKAAVPTEVSADGVRRYPREIESTVYFCVLEALNNVAKYAAATSATITLAQEDGHLTFEVHDDGAGFDVGSARSGTGLQGMADRLDAVGGSLTIVSALGDGSTVGGWVPVA
jgi:signal transduction histidine kinase